MSTYRIADLQTEQQLQFTKEVFSSLLKKELKLHSVFAPLFLPDETGLNDDLNGIEKAVSFRLAQEERSYSIVHSLAKWKRKRLQELDIPLHEGVVANMIAIRADEKLGPLHSALVDQWDWEMRISREDRTPEFLKATVEKIYRALRDTEELVCTRFRHAIPVLPEQITFLHAEELLKLYPGATSKEREGLIATEHGAVFLMGIGGKLNDGEPHDGRAPDYDDWSTVTAGGHTGLNGDILVWNPATQNVLELSSMGIRVNKTALLKQLEISGKLNRAQLPFHQSIIQEKIPLSIGGGIGQSRLAMLLLRKVSIAEVQQCEY